MCSQDDAPDTKKHFTRAPVQDGSLPWDGCSSFHSTSYNPPPPHPPSPPPPPFFFHRRRRLLVRTWQAPIMSFLNLAEISGKRIKLVSHLPAKRARAAERAENKNTKTTTTIITIITKTPKAFFAGQWRWRACAAAGPSSAGERDIWRGAGDGGPEGKVEFLWQRLQRQSWGETPRDQVD